MFTLTRPSMRFSLATSHALHTLIPPGIRLSLRYCHSKVQCHNISNSLIVGPCCIRCVATSGGIFLSMALVCLC